MVLSIQSILRLLSARKQDIQVSQCQSIKSSCRNLCKLLLDVTINLAGTKLVSVGIVSDSKFSILVVARAVQLPFRVNDDAVSVPTTHLLYLKLQVELPRDIQSHVDFFVGHFVETGDSHAPVARFPPDEQFA